MPVVNAGGVSRKLCPSRSSGSSKTSGHFAAGVSMYNREKSKTTLKLPNTHNKSKIMEEADRGTQENPKL
jgi:hypothetical protein